MPFRMQIALVPAMGLALLGCAVSEPIDVPSPDPAARKESSAQAAAA